MPKKSYSYDLDWFHYLLASLKKKKKALILDLEGVLLVTFELHADVSTPSWENHMHIVEDNNEIHAVHPNAEYFLNFCFEFFEM